MKADIYNSQSEIPVGKLLSTGGKPTIEGLNLSHSTVPSTHLFPLQTTFLTYFFYVLTYKVFAIASATAM